MGVTSGIDARGRPYRMVDGHRINLAGGKGKSRGLIGKSHAIAAPKDRIRKLMERWFGKARTGEEVKASIQSLFKGKFNLWFKIDSQTKVGRQGRLYAMREILKRLHDDTPPQEFVRGDGQLNYPRFVDHLESKHGIDISDKHVDETPKNAQNDDAEMLKILHTAGLNAQSLSALIANNK